MSARGGELVTTNESTVDAKPFLDAIVMKDSQGNRSLANPAGTDESNWGWGSPRNQQPSRSARPVQRRTLVVEVVTPRVR